MKKSIGAKTIIFPTPVLIIGTYDRAGKPNLMAAAWGGICCTRNRYANCTDSPLGIRIGSSNVGEGPIVILFQFSQVVGHRPESCSESMKTGKYGTIAEYTNLPSLKPICY